MKTNKILASLSLFLVLSLNALFVSTTYALDCVDQDNDGYIVLDSGDLDFNGNYSAEEWGFYFDEYKKSGVACDGINFKEGAEPGRCDARMVEDRSVIANGSILGNKVHPGAIDGPNNGIDEDCDGADGEFIKTTGNETDITGLFDKIINILGYYVVGGVSGLVLLWGGVTYAGAAGDDMKTTKAVKAMKGAVIGLIIGIAAPSIIHFIIDKVL